MTLDCVDCHAQISEERLKVIKNASRCTACETKYGANYRYVANVFGTPKHKGWEVQVLKVPVERPVLPSRQKDIAPQGETLCPPPSDLPQISLREYRDDSSVDKTRCFACGKRNKVLEGYTPFPGVYCPRDLRRSRQGKFSLSHMWEMV